MQTLVRWLLLLCCSTSAHALEQVLLNLVVNGVAQGDVEAIYDQEGYWIAEQSLKGAGINTLHGELISHDQTRYYRADTLGGIQSRIDTSTLTVYLDAPASEFGDKTVSLRQTHTELYPAAAPFSGYLSYRLSALYQQQGGLAYQISPTLNLNAAHFNFRSEHDYQSENQQWRRLNTTLDYDQPELMLRATLGDLSPRQAALGFNQTMAGIGISRVFSMQPDFESAPSFNSQAAITQPSTAEVYLNGQKIKTVNLQPGMYQFGDLQYFSGLQNVDIVIKDQYGGVQNIAIPYYFDDSLLKAGLSEFNYNLGLARQNGSFDHYEGLAYAAFHRFGLSDWLTVGAQASGNPDDRSYGVFGNVKLGQYGVLGLVASWAEHDTQQNGHAQKFQYRYSNGDFSLYANGQRQSAGYWRTHSELTPLTPADWSVNVGASWGNQRLGHINLEYGRQSSDDPLQNLHRYTLGYSISPWRNVSVSSQIRKVDHQLGSDWSGYLNLSWYFGSGHNLYSGAQYQNEHMRYASTLNKSAPSGEGWGYSLSAQQQDNGTDYLGWLESNLRYGQASFNVMHTAGAQGSNTNWRANWQGAIASGQGRWGATRYIHDSFAWVDTGLPNIGVTHNSSAMGNTDADGYLLLPDIASFNYQQIGLNQNDIPIEYSVNYLQYEILSGNRDGRAVMFRLQKLNAVSGQLLDELGEPLRNVVLSSQVNGKTVTISTSLDGCFYTEELTPGEYLFEAKDCTARISITPQNEVVTELGPIHCLRKGAQ
ncbi:hypothetical protein [Chitinibacter tainanensis]|uniref:hypothetical protein n=1 Tax=Chitinibacter tainanensis TaxID=230667 RepID=UPI002352BB3A|nr:hypothetical protein [Chitinibacter tainanensis]